MKETSICFAPSHALRTGPLLIDVLLRVQWHGSREYAIHKTNIELKWTGLLATMNVNSRMYHRTTLDISKSTTYTTISLAGQKRAIDEVDVGGSGSTVRNDGFRQPLASASRSKRLSASEIRYVSTKQETEYSQRRTLALTPTPTSNPLLDLSNPAYGLPEQLVNNFASLAIRSIYPWQSECLLRSGAITDDRNLVYTAPTGGGKSLVADILMLKKVIENPEKKALIVLPYVALVQEKTRWLRRVVEGITRNISETSQQQASKWRKRGDENAVRVAGFFGGSKFRATWADMDVAVCTIEKVGSQEAVSIILLTLPGQCTGQFGYRRLLCE